MINNESCQKKSEHYAGSCNHHKIVIRTKKATKSLTYFVSVQGLKVNYKIENKMKTNLNALVGIVLF